MPDLQIPDLGINLRHIQWLDYWKPDGFERLLTAIRHEEPNVLEGGNVIRLVDAVRRKTSIGSAASTRKASATNVINIAGDVKGGIVANTVQVPHPRSVRMNYPVGSVGANLHKKNYVAYLIARYFTYRDADSSYGAARSG